MAEQKNTSSSSSVTEGGGGQKSPLPGYVKDNLGKEVYEDWSARVEKDPEFAKRIPQALPDLAKTWDSAQTDLATAIKRPKDGASKEEWSNYWKQLGRPDSPKDYAFEKPTLPEGMSYSEQLETWFRDQAHANGLSTAQFKAIYEGWNKLNMEAYSKVSAEAKAKKEAADKQTAEAVGKQMADTQSALKQAWGAEAPVRMKAVVDVIHAMPKPLVDKLQAAGLLRDADFYKHMDDYRRATAEDRKLGLASEGGDGQDAEDIDQRTGRRRMKIHVASK